MLSIYGWRCFHHHCSTSDNLTLQFPFRFPELLQFGEIFIKNEDFREAQRGHCGTLSTWSVQASQNWIDCYGWSCVIFIMFIHWLLIVTVGDALLMHCFHGFLVFTLLQSADFLGKPAFRQRFQVHHRQIYVNIRKIAKRSIAGTFI